jgi:hypothetical protein
LVGDIEPTIDMNRLNSTLEARGVASEALRGFVIMLSI